MMTFWNKYRIKQITTTAYHPQGNGLVERMNQTIKGILAKLVHEHQGDWDLYLPSTLFAIRTNKQDSTRTTPFKLTYGREATKRAEQDLPQIKGEKTEEQLLEYRVKTEIEELQDIRRQAAEFISKAQERQRRNYEQGHKETTPLKLGDKVLLYRDNIVTSWSAKLEPKWDGPYYIHSINKTTYQLKKLTGELLAFKTHRNRLKKYHDAKILS
jgi:hypothetical protein